MISEKQMTGQWASWSCYECGVEHDDPVGIKVTTCANGHVNHLGRVWQSHQGAHRQAFKSIYALRKEASRRSFHRHLLAAAMKRK